MNVLRLTIVAGTVFGSVALAQVANPYNGTWTIKFDGAARVNLEGTVVVKDDGGSYKVLAQSKNNPCVGREAPLNVKSATADELVFEVTRSKVLSGCEDYTLRFKRVDDKTLQGSLADGRKITLTRE